MRRFATWFVVVVLAGSGSLAIAGTATASAEVSRPASFCSTAKSLAGKIKNFDPSDLNDSEIFATGERLYKKLAKDAPSSLKPAFKRITSYYKSLQDEGGTPTDPEDIQAFVEQSTKAGKALNKVIRYLSSKCDIDLG